MRDYWPGRMLRAIGAGADMGAGACAVAGAARGAGIAGGAAGAATLAGAATADWTAADANAGFGAESPGTAAVGTAEAGADELPAPASPLENTLTRVMAPTMLPGT